jgi:hypothetical protein
MDTDYFKEKLIDLQKSNTNKFTNINEILVKCNEYENNIEQKIIVTFKEIETISNTQKEINTLFDTICINLF